MRIPILILLLVAPAMAAAQPMHPVFPGLPVIEPATPAPAPADCASPTCPREA
jgi:hypothetical protein